MTKKMRKSFISKTGQEQNEDWLLGQPGVELRLVEETHPDGSYSSIRSKYILECSTKGDRDYSALCAQVDVYGEFSSIEEHYQRSKLFYERDGFGDLITDSFDRPILNNFGDSKGQNPDMIQIGTLRLDKTFSEQWYQLLWIKYFDQNPHLVDYLMNFDDFNDIFKGKSLNCQADIARKYRFQGREEMMNECRVLLKILDQQNRVNKQYVEEHEAESSYDMDTHL
jgi:hypothetical protein